MSAGKQRPAVEVKAAQPAGDLKSLKTEKPKATGGNIQMPSAAARSEAEIEAMWEAYQKQMAKDKEYEDGGMDIFPDPGFVAKFDAVRKSGERCKVYVNLCGDRAISEAVYEEEGDSSKLRVPASVGPERQDVDASTHDSHCLPALVSRVLLRWCADKQPCIVFDVVLNSDTVDRCKKQLDMKKAIVAVVAGKLLDKYAVEMVTGTPTPSFASFRLWHLRLNSERGARRTQVSSTLALQGWNSSGALLPAGRYQRCSCLLT